MLCAVCLSPAKLLGFEEIDLDTIPHDILDLFRKPQNH